mmetsp:Transcript_33946/g.44789  ORF Transcript_33946/g.44789 Transcript_33946/m.44789 type:complete len:330 (-) Transcript_33946:668-1657(-)
MIRTVLASSTQIWSCQSQSARVVVHLVSTKYGGYPVSSQLQLNQVGFRSFSSKVSGATSAKENPKQEKGRLLGILVLGSIVAGTAGLGVWQTQRYYWKIDQIEERRKRLQQVPQFLPESTTVESLSSLSKNHEYTPFKLNGTFLHDYEILVGPRSAPKSVYGAATGLGTNPTGCIVLTPLQRPDGTLVIVNRGWVPKEEISSLNRPTGPIQLCGIVMKGEKKAQFTPDNDEAANLFFWIDHEYLGRRVKHLWNSTGQPILLEQVSPEATQQQAKRFWPYSKQLHEFEVFHVMPETHAVYAITWYSLACFGTVATWLRFRKRVPLPSRKK